MRRAAAMLAGVALAAAGCASQGGGAAGPWSTNPHAVLNASLVSFDSCDAALERLKEDALARVGPYGLDGVGGPTAFAEDSTRGATSSRSSTAAPTTTSGAAASAPSSAGTAGVGDVSTTNVQEQGVDEPDVVKTRSDLLVTVVDSTVRVLTLSPGGPSLVGAVSLDRGYGHQLLLDGDHLLVVATSDGGIMPMDGVAPSATQGVPTTVTGSSGSSSGGVAAPTSPEPGTLLWSIDLSNPAAPTVTGTTLIDGSLVSARSVDGTARVVTTSSPTAFDFVYPSRPGAEASALAANRAMIEFSTIEDWLPTWRPISSDGAAGTPRALVDCAALDTPSEFSGFGTLAVSTIDLREGAVEPRDSVGVLGAGETVYASATSLYVATNQYQVVDAPSGGSSTRMYRPTTQETAIHRFDIRGDGPATYRASGLVRGRVLDQFSLSEYEDVLRVATTDTNAMVGGAVPASESFVTTLGESDGELRAVGQLGDLGRGEQIKAVRFLGPTGYVVTFRQTDPLYTLDLSDPAAPAVVGELKVTGFSSYLHPLGDGRLLGVGQDATTQGRVTGLQVALFDVSDPANPALVQKYTLPGASSDAGQDHHAFLWWAPASLAVLPVAGGSTSDGGYTPFVGAIGLTVDAGGIAERGRVTHPAASTSGGSTSPSCPPGANCIIEPGPGPMPDHGATILRTVVAGSEVLTVSSAGLKASAIDTLADRAWVPFA